MTSDDKIHLMGTGDLKNFFVCHGCSPGGRVRCPVIIKSLI